MTMYTARDGQTVTIDPQGVVTMIRHYEDDIAGGIDAMYRRFRKYDWDREDCREYLAFCRSEISRLYAVLEEVKQGRPYLSTHLRPGGA